MNPCPCGFFGDTTKECRCTGAIIQRYLGKISGPLLDRIDLHMEVPAVAYKELRSNAAGRVVGRDAGASRARLGRFNKGEASTTRIFRTGNSANFVRWMRQANARLRWPCDVWVLSARAHDRILKVARTMADLGRSDSCLRQARRRSRAIPQPGSELLGLTLLQP